MNSVPNQVQATLAQGLTRDLQLEQCTAGYFKLPVVPKHLYQGPRGGLLYVNQKGKRVYLNSPQKRRLLAHKLPGVTNAAVPDFHYGQIPTSVFERVNRQLHQVGGR